MTRSQETARSQSTGASVDIDAVVAAALLTTYGYRKLVELRGELIIDHGRVVSDTLHLVEILERDRSGQSSNPLNEWDEYEQMEAEPDGNLCDSGWCGDSACYRCNPRGYPR